MDIATCLKAHGVRDSFASDSDSGGKSDLDEDYYRHLPAPIPQEQLLSNSVIAKNLNVKEEDSVDTMSLYSEMLKKLPLKPDVTPNKVAKKKNKAKKQSPSDSVTQNGLNGPISLNQQSVAVKTEENQPQNALNHQNQVRQETPRTESEKLSELIKEEIRMEFEKLRFEYGFTRKEHTVPSLLKPSVAQSLPSIPRAVEQNATKANKKKKKKEEVTGNTTCLVEVKKIEKIFNYVDSAEKCLQAMIKKAASNDTQENVNPYSKLHHALDVIQYAQRDLKMLKEMNKLKT